MGIKFFKNLFRIVLNKFRYLYYVLLRVSSKSKEDEILQVGQVVNFKSESYLGTLPIKIVTSSDYHNMTTFYDIEPLSPCGKFLLVTNVPFTNRIPFLGEKAAVCVVDIESGNEQCVYHTSGWGAQLGANVQWGNNSETIYCNDIVNDKVVGIRIDLKSLKYFYLDGPIYAINCDSRYSFSPNLKIINNLIPGYGVPESLFSRYKQDVLEPKQDGVWKTDLFSGKTELLLSISDLVNSIKHIEYFKNSKYSIFHIKLNRNSNKMFLVLFSYGKSKAKEKTNQLISYDFCSKEIKLLLTNEEWSKGGHHPNWMPNGVDILMNLKLNSEKMQFVKIDSDTGDKTVLLPNLVGGGHPSVSTDMHYLLTDAYVSEGLGDSEGKVPIRLLDMTTQLENKLSRIYTENRNGPCRIDPHPVWSRNRNAIIWNGIKDGKRRVFVADTKKLIANGLENCNI